MQGKWEEVVVHLGSLLDTHGCVSIKYAFVPCILEEKDIKYGHVHSFFPSFITRG